MYTQHVLYCFADPESSCRSDLLTVLTKIRTILAQNNAAHCRPDSPFFTDDISAVAWILEYTETATSQNEEEYSASVEKEVRDLSSRFRDFLFTIRRVGVEPESIDFYYWHDGRALSPETSADDMAIINRFVPVGDDLVPISGRIYSQNYAC